MPSATPFPVPFAFFPLAGMLLISFPADPLTCSDMPALAGSYSFICQVLGILPVADSEAFFAAADNNLSADATIALTSGYGGKGFNTQWVEDNDVGVVVECTKVPLHPSPGSYGSFCYSLLSLSGQLYLITHHEGLLLAAAIWVHCCCALP